MRDLIEVDLATGGADTADFAQPGTAIEAVAADLVQLWDRHRSAGPNERKVGCLGLASGAYLQWIGYSDRVVVEVSSNAYLSGAARLSAEQERAIVGAGFSPPDADEPNFWLRVADRARLGQAAFAIVGVLTAAFGVYAG